MSEPTSTPDLELACHHQAIEILRLNQLVATERAAREQCEATWRVLSEDVKVEQQRAEQAEARLVEAMKLLEEARSCLNAWGPAPSDAFAVNDISNFLSSTAPPPLLAELQGLRDGMDALVKGTIAAKEKSNTELDRLREKCKTYEQELKRGKAHGTEAVLGKCPQCLAWTVTLDMMACLKCDWSISSVQKKAEQELAALKLKLEQSQDELSNIGRKAGLWWANKQAETADEVKSLKLKLEVAKVALKYYAQPAIYERGPFDDTHARVIYDCGMAAKQALSQLNSK